MKIRFHTVAAIVVLVASGLWVASGKYAFVGSDLTDGGQAAAAPAQAATAPATTAAEPKPADALQSVGFVVAKPAPYARSIHLSGQTEADKQVTLVARSSGAIANLPVAEGDRLEEGGLVMALDAPEKPAAVVSAQSQFDTAASQADTGKKLFDGGTMPKHQYELLVAAREASRSALESAKAEVDRLEARAPFAGLIDKVFVETGAWVQPGTEIATLLALDPIVVVGEVGERDLQTVEKGTKAQVTFGDGTRAEGVVRYVRREASGQTRTYPIEVAIPNPGFAISVGMSAEIELAAKTVSAVILPRSVVTLDADGHLGVRVLTPSDSVAFQAVAIVDDTPDGLVVTGIAPDARIITSGQNMVSEGQQVTATLAAATTVGSN